MLPNDVKYAPRCLSTMPQDNTHSIFDDVASQYLGYMCQSLLHLSVFANVTELS